MISLIPAPHNLHNYDELGVTWRHRPFAATTSRSRYLAGAVPRAQATCWPSGTKVLIHGEELGDRICGAVAGYLLWDGLIDTGPRTVIRDRAASPSASSAPPAASWSRWPPTLPRPPD